jgi:hypothetical protein
MKFLASVELLIPSISIKIFVKKRFRVDEDRVEILYEVKTGKFSKTLFSELFNFYWLKHFQSTTSKQKRFLKKMFIEMPRIKSFTNVENFIRIRDHF